MQKRIFTLREFNTLVRSLIETGLPDSYLVTAEIASLRFDQKGHCYLDLIEKDDGATVAQMRAAIWSSQYRGIANRFRMITGMKLEKGMKLLIEAELTFHERYGLSFTIVDIDPSYTMGEVAVRRREILERLGREGLLEKNRKCEFPLVPLRIAVISSPFAAGYGDFREHLRTNQFGYGFEVTLFRAQMQGDSAEESIAGAFRKCCGMISRFDLAVIIRGGGADSDLHCFDSYEIGKSVAEMTVPVISGIGHERDRTVADEVAHTSVKTPTAAAALVIQRVRDFHLRVLELETGLLNANERLIRKNMAVLYGITRDLERNVSRFLALEDAGLRSCIKSLSRAKSNLINASGRLASLGEAVSSGARRRIRDQEEKIGHGIALMRAHLKSYLGNCRRSLIQSETVVVHLDPKNVLRRGYSITLKNGKPLKDVLNLSAGDIIETALLRGKISSRVTGVETDDEKKTADLQGSSG